MSDPVEVPHGVSIRCSICGMDVKDKEHPAGVCKQFAAAVIAEGPPKKPTLKVIKGGRV